MKIERLLKKQYIRIIVVIPLVFALATGAYDFFVESKLKNMVIEFNYPGVEQGLNPDGSVFDISEFKSDEIIDEAKKGLKCEKSDTEFLKSRISISSKMSEKSMEEIVASVEKNENTVYMPTTFYVYYSQKNKLAKNETNAFLKNLADAYKRYFNRRYAENNDILIYNKDSYDFSDMDYPEIYTAFLNRATSMHSYISNHKNENRAFMTTDQVNLSTAAKELENFKNVNLEKFNSFIMQNGISKNSEDYIKRCNYIIEKNRIDYRKQQGASDIANNALQLYDPNIAAVTFVPSVDSSKSYYMSKTKTAIDDLTKQSYEDGVSAARVSKKISEVSDARNKFSAKVPMAQTGIDRAEEMVLQLTDELERISEKVYRIDNEYLSKKTKNYLSVKIPERVSYFEISAMIKSFVLGLILAAAIIVLTELFREKIKKEITALHSAAAAMKSLGRKRGE